MNAATIGRMITTAIGGLLAISVGYVLFLVVPTSAVELLGVLLVIATALVGLRIAGGFADTVFSSYNVAHVAIEGPISRGGGGGFPPGQGAIPTDEVVERIEDADDDSDVEGLLVELNTPGGEVVPSDDVRRAIVAFEGPTVAYTTDVCGSGGYWIASGCDELLARDGSLVGSVGVIGSRVNAADLAERVGISYERFAAGEFKDAGVSLRDIEEHERAYLQGLIDDFYGQFVERVAEGRDLSKEEIRATEARVYVGEEALELGLVDALGTREDAESRLGELLDVEVDVREFEPRRGLRTRLTGGSAAIAYAFGAGIASVLGDSDREIDVRL